MIFIISDIRKQAEGVLKGKTTDLKKLSAGNIQRLIHELKVHQIQLEMQNEELRRTQKELEEARNRYSDLYDFSPVGYFTFDKNGLILEVNLTGTKKLRRERSHLIKKPFSLYIRGNKDTFYSHLREVFNTEKQMTCELRLVDTKGNIFDALLESMPVHDSDGNLLARTAMSVITERKSAEEKIEASLKEKEILLREIHHRVKNNMQIISSLLGLASGTIKEKKYMELFRDCQYRINSMSLIHEKLYCSQNFEKIDFNEYIGDLANDLFQSRGVAGKIELSLNIEKISLDIDHAIPCGLIINELITNSIKYAFPENRKGEIKISLHLNDENMIELVVSDNGVGIPEDLGFISTESLGLHLVKILSEDQLHGKIDLDRSNGTEYNIKFLGGE